MDYFLLGKSLKHTLSPEIHKFFGVDYSVLEVEEENLSSVIEKKAYKGFNVTIPYKQTIIPFLDFIDSAAKEIGAVNTVINKEGKLFGYNTDAGGMESALKKAQIELYEKTVLILGSGGTSKTAQYVAKKLNARKILKASRSGEINYDNVYENQDIEVIINTTPVGMYPNIEGKPIEITKFTKLSGVFDAVYNPLKTSLVLDAEKLNINASGGLFMLIEQARLSDNLFTDKIKRQNLSDVLYNKMLSEKRNIVLVGMPGSGKTSIGEELAKKLSRPFFDSDRLIEEKSKMTVTDIFKLFGENAFRKSECEVILELSKLNGAVIASGGGAILNSSNFTNLKKNGLGIFIKRDLSSLSIKNRPLSKDLDTLKLMEKERTPIYEAFSEVKIQNNDIISAAEEILKYYENLSN